ncbi:MAG TPA: polymer-forming cytoskeletal protein [Candidatus Sulfomarinibacteraceae bacterium]|nr:polymer-forming cytoskeletal protein [Candidatus Sulfomarinibacteraceae bacterium]
MADRHPDSTPPQRRFTDSRDGTASVIGRDLRLEGTLHGAADLEIWGSFEGEMTVEGLVCLRPGSRFTGELHTTDLVAEGELVGIVHATGKVDLRATCRLEGDVTANRVAAADGAFVEGRITVTGKADEVVGYSERRGS